MKHFLEPGRTPRMTPFTRHPIDVAAAAAQLDAHPQLWNTFTLRTTQYKGGPHAQVDDIFVRYRDRAEYQPKFPSRFHGKHFPVWYPAYGILTELRPLIFGLMTEVNGESLGLVLITRIPAGGRVLRHKDGGWHAEHFQRKFVISLRSNHEQSFCFEGESMKTVTGEVFEFDNLHEHFVLNPSDEPRISLIVCIHTSGAT